MQTVMQAAGSSSILSLDFALPNELEAHAPPEARGLARHAVRLLVSHYQSDRLMHSAFGSLPRFLGPGDVLVINTSGTLPAALIGQRDNGEQVHVHVSTIVTNEIAPLAVVELRRLTSAGSQPLYDAVAGEAVRLATGHHVTLLAPSGNKTARGDGKVRLWLAQFDIHQPLPAYLAQHGFPIRYSYVEQAWPIEAYQTVYATEAGSAEMPSAGRAFSAELITKLVAFGVEIVPLLLHTGVASLEDHEAPYPEPYRVSADSAARINSARARGKRIIAVGTTSVRALETVADENGYIYTGKGWTELVITPERGLRVVDGLLTGFHEPRATHLAMLQALTGVEHLKLTYASALHERYLWHEFGDLHLILP